MGKYKKEIGRLVNILHKDETIVSSVTNSSFYDVIKLFFFILFSQADSQIESPDELLVFIFALSIFFRGLLKVIDKFYTYQLEVNVVQVYYLNLHSFFHYARQ